MVQQQQDMLLVMRMGYAHDTYYANIKCLHVCKHKTATYASGHQATLAHKLNAIGACSTQVYKDGSIV